MWFFVEMKLSIVEQNLKDFKFSINLVVVNNQKIYKDFSYSFSKVIKMEYSRFYEMARKSTMMNAVADIGKISSLLYGVANVIDDEPNMYKIIGAVVVYSICGVRNHIARGIAVDTSLEPIKGRLDRLEEMLD